MLMNKDINQFIRNKLNNFLERKNVPNMLFYGNPGSGKKTLLHEFLLQFYGSETIMKEYVMYVDCELGKGIKFIRDELKFFAKTNSINKGLFKSIILLNADKLTIDAQSALRRCIELFSETNRFFIVVEKIEKLQKPILSRFCHIFVNCYSEDVKNTHKNIINLHDIKIENYITNNSELFKLKEYRKKKLKNILNKFEKNINESEKSNKTNTNKTNTNDLIGLAETLYENAYCAYDIYSIIKKDKKYSYEEETIYTIAKNTIKNEILLITFYLFFLFRNNKKIEIYDFIKYG